MRNNAKLYNDYMDEEKQLHHDKRDEWIEQRID